MTRKNFSPAVIKARLVHAGYQCEATMTDGTRCPAKAEPGRFQCDHDNPDGLTGQPVFENARILCLAHHAEKTARDVKNIRKAQRRESRHMGLPGKDTNLKGRSQAAKNAEKAERTREAGKDQRVNYGAFSGCFRFREARS